jgi:hypothetical protein
MQYAYTFYVSRNRGFVELTAHTPGAKRKLDHIIRTLHVTAEGKVDFSTLYFCFNYRGPWCDKAELFFTWELIERINAAFSPRGGRAATLSIRYLTVMGSGLTSSTIWLLLNEADSQFPNPGKVLEGWSAEQQYSREQGEILR